MHHQTADIVRDRRVWVPDLAVYALLVIGKLAGGVFTGSKALSVGAVFTLQLLLATFLCRRHAGTSGPRLALLVTGAANAVLMAAVTGFFLSLVHAVLSHPGHTPGTAAPWLALGGCLVSLLWQLGRTRSRPLRRVRVPADSAAAGRIEVAAGLAAAGGAQLDIWELGRFDLWVALALSLALGAAAMGWLWRAARGLMDGSVGQPAVSAIRSGVRRIHGVQQVTSLVAVQHGYHCRVFLSVLVSARTTLLQAERVRSDAEKLIRQQLGASEVLVGFGAVEDASAAEEDGGAGAP